MKRLMLAAGVAALAIAAPVSAQKGGKGGGNGGGGGQAAKVERGGGGASRMQARGGGGGGGQAIRMERRGGGGQAFARGGGGRQEMRQRIERPRFAQQARGPERQAFRAERAKPLRQARVERPRGPEQFRGGNRPIERVRDIGRVADRGGNLRAARRDWNDNVRVASRNWTEVDRWENVRSRAYSCPPGLAAKGNGCMAPGQAKQLIGAALPAAYASAYLPDYLQSYYRDNDDYYYRYGDGYVYQVNRTDNLVASLLPLFGGSFGLGQTIPLTNPNYYVPSSYSSFFPDTPYSAYRYDDGYLYQVNPYTGLVEDVSPMLGYGYGVGQMLPAGYSAYNVPYQYRDMYYDTDDAYYRYAPGAIYQVDPQTNLITSVASLLTGSPLSVGQRLPSGYDVYNVPYAYRDRYYDTSEDWYRYADGNIYQVDPTTQLITAVIDAIV